MALTDARKGELARMVLVQMLMDGGIKIGNELRREIGNKAKTLGVDFAELMEFSEEVIEEVLRLSFAPPKEKPMK